MKIAKIYLVILFVITFISGCASGPVAARKAEYLGANKLYIDLVKFNESLMVSKISNKEGDFLLNDFGPTFDIKEQDCGTWKFNTPDPKHGRYCDYSDIRFRYNAIDKTMQVIGTIGTAGGATLLGLNSRYSYFDPDKHWEGMHSALKNSNIDRIAFFKKYDELVDFRNNIQKQHENIVSGLNQGYSDIYDKYVLPYKNKYEKHSINLIIDDKSGLYRNDIDKNKIVSVSKKDFSWNNITFNKYDIVLNSAPHDYYQALDKIKSDFKLMLEKDAEKVKSELIAYDKFLSEKTNELVVSKLDNENSSYNYEISAPPTINVENINLPIIPVKLKVLSKNYYKVYPQTNISDDNLKMMFDGKHITVNNKTSKFLQIKSISTYYNNDIVTLQCDKELPPQSEANLNDIARQIVDYNFTNQNNYLNMTYSIANKLKINFGFAVKYRLVEQNIDKTLYKINTHNLYNVLSTL